MRKNAFLSLVLVFTGCAALGLGARPNDAELKYAILSALHDKKDLDIAHVEVDVTAGVVVVSGLASSPEQEKELESVVYHVSGVKNPVFNLAVHE